MLNIYTLKIGSEVKGHYHGAEFTGVVADKRCHTINNDEVIFYIDLHNPITVMGSVREDVCMRICDTTAATREFPNNRLYA